MFANKKRLYTLGCIAVGVIAILTVYFTLIATGVINIKTDVIVIASGSSDKIYDGQPLTNSKWEIEDGKLHSGHNLIVEITGINETIGEVPNTFTSKILDSNGLDVTSKYQVRHNYGTLLIRPFPITFITESHEKMFDGIELTGNDNDWRIDGDIVDGHTLSVKMNGKITFVGSVDNSAVVVIKDENNKDVTEYYSIVYELGTLTINHRPISIETLGALRMYDGLPLTQEGVIYDELSLAPGHSISVITTGTITYVGKVQNTFNCVILDQNKNDVTDQYLISSTLGDLEITRRNITISTLSAEKTYDATPLTNKNYVFDESTLAPNETINVDVTGTITNVGTEVNSFTVTIYNQDNIDVTDQYRINKEVGKLTVLYVYIVIESEYGEKVYDGTPLVKDIPIIHGSVLDVHQLEVIVTGKLTIVGEVINDFTYTILDEDGNDISYNYQVTKDKNILVVRYREITISSLSDEKQYDGTPLIKHERDLFGTVAPNQDLIIDFTGTITEVGTKDNTYTFKILDENGEDVSRNYDVITLYGTLTIYHVEITITSNTDSKEYDGTLLASTYVMIGTVASTHDINVDISEGIIDVGTMINEFTVTITNQEGHSVIDNYIIKKIVGELTITKRVINITTPTLNEFYNGEIQSNTNSEFSREAAPNQEFKIVSYMKEVNIITNENIIIYSVIDSNGNDVTKNYELNVTFGSFIIKKLPIVLTSNSKIEDYNDEYFYENTYESSITIPSADSINVTDYDRIKAPGTLTNVLTYEFINSNGEDVRNNYEVTFVDGTVTVRKISISLQSKNLNENYNGNIVVGSHDDVTITSGGIFPGHSHSYIFSNGIENAGVYFTANSFLLEVIYNGENISDYYDVSYIYGDVTIHKADIFITTPTLEKYYDGDILTGYIPDGDDYDMVGTLYNLDEISYKLTGQILNYGFTLNEGEFIVMSNGVISGNYNIVFTPGKLIIHQVVLNITTGTSDKVYDGLPLKNEEYNVYTPLVGEDKVIIDEAPEIVDSKAIYNFIKFKVISNGQESNNYKFNVTPGTLTISPRMYTITTDSKKVDYNGNPVVADSLKYFDLLLNYKVFIFDYSSEFINAGTYSNSAKYVILDENGNVSDTSNYVIKLEYGDVVINKADIYVTTESATLTYNGLEQKAEGYSVSGLLYLGATVQCVENFPFINAGVHENKMSFVVIHNGQISNNYKIIPNNGTLTINKADIYVTTESATLTYNGLEQKAEGYSVSGLLYLGATVQCVENFPFINAGVHENEMSFVVIHNGQISNNYKINTTTGNVTINKYSVTITTESDYKEFDGTPLIKEEVVGGIPTLFNGDVLQIVGYRTNAINAGVYDNSAGYVISGNASNYDVTIIPGKLTIDKFNVTLTTNNGYQVYNGQALIVERYTLSTHNLFGYTIEVDNFFDDAINAGDYSNTASYIIKDSTGALSDGDNFNVILKYGTLTVSKVQIEITTSSNEFVYNSTAQLMEDYVYSGFLPNGYKIKLNGYFDQAINAGTYTNTANWSILDNNNNPVSGQNFFVEIKYGTITIKKLDVTITTNSDHKTYDGLPLIADGYTQSVSLYNGYKFIVSNYVDDFADVGTMQNTATWQMVDASNSQVSHNNYNVTIKYGTLTILGKNGESISITPATVKEKFVGNPVYAVNVILGFEYFEALGYTYDVDISGVQTEAGVGTSIINNIIIYKGAEDVTSEFIITTNPGKIIAYSYELTINAVTKDVSKVYDGVALTNKDYNLTGQVSGHNYDVVITGSQLHAGTSINSYTIRITDEFGIDITDLYNVTNNLGLLTVTRRTLVVSIDDVIVNDTGTLVVVNENDMTFNIQDIEMYDGYTFEFKASGTAFGVGTWSVIQIESCKITKDGVDVSSNFTINLTSLGKLIIV